MPYLVHKPFRGDGVEYQPGDTAPDSINHSGAVSWLLGGGYLTEVAAEGSEQQTGGDPVPLQPAESDTASPETETHPPELRDRMTNATYGAVKYAEAKDIDLSQVEGSGTDGKVTKRDVELYDEQQSQENEEPQEEEAEETSAADEPEESTDKER